MDIRSEIVNFASGAYGHFPHSENCSFSEKASCVFVYTKTGLPGSVGPLAGVPVGIRGMVETPIQTLQQ